MASSPDANGTIGGRQGTRSAEYTRISTFLVEPDPAVVTIGDNRDYIGVLGSCNIYHYYRVGVLLKCTNQLASV